MEPQSRPVQADFPLEMERRNDRRSKRRLTCEIWVEGRPHNGTVLDSSAHGLFVQTRAEARPGSVVRVKVRSEQGPVLEADATVTHRMVLPHTLDNLGLGGLGLRIEDETPEATKPGPIRGSLAIRPQRPRPSAAHARRIAQNLVFYRVILSEDEGSGLRNVVVAAGSERDAKLRGLAHVGNGWSVLDVTPE